MDFVKEIKDFVETECRKPTSKYGYEPFIYHFKPTVEYADKLSDKLGGNKEVILISAWIHDIGSIIHGRKDHHITGAEIAEKKLLELGYPKEKIELVKKCILNHRGSNNFETESIEEQIVAEADAMSNFNNILGILNAAFVYEHLNQGDAKVAVKKKLRNKWKQLKFDESKKIVEPLYDAAMLLLS